MNEFQQWMADVESYGYNVDEMLEQIKLLQDGRNYLMEDYQECEKRLKTLQMKLSMIHAKKRYFEILLEKVAR